MWIRVRAGRPSALCETLTEGDMLVVTQIMLSDDGSDPFGEILAEQFPVFKKSPPTSPWGGEC